MSFRRTLNAHDRWLRYCQAKEIAVRATGLPAEMFHRSDVLEGFLERGSFRTSGRTDMLLQEMPDTAFLALEEIVNGYFDFQESYPAFLQERFRRFQRYG